MHLIYQPLYNVSSVSPSSRYQFALFHHLEVLHTCRYVSLSDLLAENKECVNIHENSYPDQRVSPVKPETTPFACLIYCNHTLVNSRNTVLLRLAINLWRTWLVGSN